MQKEGVARPHSPLPFPGPLRGFRWTVAHASKIRASVDKERVTLESAALIPQAAKCALGPPARGSVGPGQRPRRRRRALSPVINFSTAAGG